MTNEERTNKIITEFYLLYGAFDSSTGALVGMRTPETIQGMADWWRIQISTALDEVRHEGKDWYFEGDELVIKKGKWVIDRYKKHEEIVDLASKEGGKK